MGGGFEGILTLVMVSIDIFPLGILLAEPVLFRLFVARARGEKEGYEKSLLQYNKNFFNVWIKDKQHENGSPPK